MIIFSRTVQVTAEDLKRYVKPFVIKLDRLTADQIASWKRPQQRTPPQVESSDDESLSDSEQPIRIMKRSREPLVDLTIGDSDDNDQQRSMRRSPRRAKKMMPLSAKRGRSRKL